MATEMIVAHDELPQLFEDVTPVPQDDGPNPICQIDYSPQFVQAYDYMRAILKTGEKTERTLRLTGLCLKLNPANYTIWHFRRQILEALRPDSDDEYETLVRKDLELAATLGGANPKNYQIWYHRRALMESDGTRRRRRQQAGQGGGDEMESSFVQDELAYVAQVLQEDSKNYHAWSYRQWIARSVNESSLWEKELQFAHSLIQQDPRNNSAWNYRWFVCHQGGNNKTLPLEDANKEADYAIQGASLDPYNESPWRFLIGILKEQCKVVEDRTSLLDDFESKVLAQREVIEKAGKDPDGCSNLVSARIDILEFKGDPSSLEKAMELASTLANEHDPIRKKYWLLRVEEMRTAALS